MAGRVFESCFVVLVVWTTLAQPAHRWRSSNNGDLNKIYDTATPNPTGSLSGPWFDMTEDERDVTGIAGKVTHLVCRIKNLGNHTISWVRHRDTNLLTIGLLTFTKDRRISAIHRSSSEDWVLEIRATRLSDKGLYECQISTTPVRSYVMHLSVAEPSVTLRGVGELHVKDGSRIEISCEIANFPRPITFVTWYKDGKSLHGSPRHRVSLRPKPAPPTNSSSSASSSSSSYPDFVSSIVVEHATEVDSGKYGCDSEAGESGLTDVHVITGETRAGLQVNAASALSPSSPSSSAPPHSLWPPILLTLLHHLRFRFRRRRKGETL